ncbi:hypothetical protein ACFFJT_17440 [Dyella flava]|uniref:Uncharacterized protein n=1 Tax=Dyella flava TaxID=1920170 RepID=A0ABS2K377_9GAMM|nr:hypothetical protein [Dyella flava]MBM7125700.1 hypothetical protein [Dyella flava]GLQ48784.1 hypothetical protein GCM10010872_02330 [Dyella flava]
MFCKSHALVSRKAIIGALLTATLSISALASQPPSTGLGQAWPNAADVSVSPHFHVYLFVREGVRYIQVNDLNGTVLGAVAVADHVVLTLPVGVDAAYVTTSSSSSGETVYRDGATQITALAADNGTVVLNVIDGDACTKFDCTGQVTSGPDTCTKFDCTGQVVSKTGQ